MNFLKFVFGKTSRVKLVEEHDFPEYLKRIGVFEDVISGNEFCVSCGQRITINNLQAVIPGDRGRESVRFVCDKAVCLKQDHD